MDPLIGKIIDDAYSITAVLGRGGMGVVYKAWDTMLEKDVAIKMLKADYADNPELLKFFHREGKSQAQLEHPNIIHVYLFRKSEFGLYIVMEFVDGINLAQMLTKGALQIDETKRIFKQLLLAMDYAHSRKVIHRDIKPNNVMIAGNGTVKVADFGLAKIQKAGASSTKMVGGTLRYMSPEQVRGLGYVDHRGDVYSLGMTLYETLVGRLPFDEDASEFTVMQTITDGKVPPPEALKQDLQPDLAAVIKKAIDPNPENRFQSAGDMWKALEACKEPPVSVDDLTVVINPSVDTKEKSRVWFYSLIALFVVVLVGYLITRESGNNATDSGTNSVVDTALGKIPVKDSIRVERDSSQQSNQQINIIQASSVAELASELVSDLRHKMPETPKVVVLPFTMKNNKSAGSFSPYLQALLEEKLVDASWPVGEFRNINPGAKDITQAFAMGAGASHLVTGSYWEEGDMIKCRAEIMRVEDRARIASTEGIVPAGVIKTLKLSLKPANFSQVVKDEALFAKGEVKNAALKLEVWTNRGVDNVIFAEGDTMMVYARVNKPCFLRLVYHLADRKRTVLLDNMEIGATQINKPIQVEGKFLCSSPFGAEYLQAFANTEQFESLETVEENGYAYLKQDLGQALLAMRGMKPIKPGALQTETRVTLTTVGKTQ